MNITKNGVTMNLAEFIHFMKEHDTENFVYVRGGGLVIGDIIGITKDGRLELDIDDIPMALYSKPFSNVALSTTDLGYNVNIQG